MLGVASVLGGFAISDSQRHQSERLFARIGGTDKLNVLPTDTAWQGTPSALQNANLGLRLEDATEGRRLTSAETVNATSVIRQARARVRSEFADQERDVSGIGADYVAMNGYEIEQGRGFSAHDLETGAPVAILGSQAASVFFPTGEIVGKPLRIGDTPVVVIGVFAEKVFRFNKGQNNMFAWRNRIVAVPSLLVAGRMEGDDYHRLDRVTFRVPDLEAMTDFSKELSSLVTANHRLQDDFRLDDVAKRMERMRSQGEVYNIIFMLSGVLALLGEIFKAFMTEALLLTLLGSLVGFVVGVGFSWVITWSIGIPLMFSPLSFVWATALALVFGFLFALYPAAKASRQSPMEALRYE
jgi:ABC-type antimicrobial peptide transport system permease subunit